MFGWRSTHKRKASLTWRLSAAMQNELTVLLLKEEGDAEMFLTRDGKWKLI